MMCLPIDCLNAITRTQLWETSSTGVDSFHRVIGVPHNTMYYGSTAVIFVFNSIIYITIFVYRTSDHRVTVPKSLYWPKTITYRSDDRVSRHEGSMIP